MSEKAQQHFINMATVPFKAALCKAGSTCQVYTLTVFQRSRLSENQNPSPKDNECGGEKEGINDFLVDISSNLPYSA